MPLARTHARSRLDELLVSVASVRKSCDGDGDDFFTDDNDADDDDDETGGIGRGGSAQNAGRRHGDKSSGIGVGGIGIGIGIGGTGIGIGIGGIGIGGGASSRITGVTLLVPSAGVVPEHYRERLRRLGVRTIRRRLPVTSKDKK